MKAYPAVSNARRVLARWLLIAAATFSASATHAAVFSVNDPYAGQGAIDTLGLSINSAEGFVWPWPPGPFTASMSASGQFPSGNPWVGCDISRSQSSFSEDHPDAVGYTLTFSLHDRPATQSEWVTEQLTYYKSTGPDHTILDPTILVTTSFGQNLSFTPNDSPPGDFS